MVWLSVDPGETVGWALWDDKTLVDAGQTERVQFIDDVADGVMVGQQNPWEPGPPPHGPFDGVKKLVIEEFKIYPWKAQSLQWDELRTSRAIGALEFIARQAGLEIRFQPATIKDFALSGGAAELFQTPRHENRHANDAIMHGFYYIYTALMGNKVQLPSASAIQIDPEATVSDARN